MTRWMKVLAAVAALGTAPALAADTTAQAKDRKHEQDTKKRMSKRAHEKSTGAGEAAQQGADQVGDAARVGGAKTARAYHGGVHSGKKAVHHGAKKAADATK